MSIFVTLWAVAVVLAWTLGRQPERIGGAILFAMAPLQISLRLAFPRELASFDPGTFLTDIAALSGFLALALYANRMWPLWVCSLQVVVVIGHLVRLIDNRAIPGEQGWLVYGAMIKAPAYLQCLLLIGGVIKLREVLRAGLDCPSWRQ